MKILLIIGLIVSVILITGCASQTQQYVCPDGNVVSDPMNCPKKEADLSLDVTTVNSDKINDYEFLWQFSTRQSNQYGYSPIVSITNNGTDNAYQISFSYICYNENGNAVLAKEGDSHKGWYITSSTVTFANGGSAKENTYEEVLEPTYVFSPELIFTSKAGFEFLNSENSFSWNWSSVELPVTFRCNLEVEDKDGHESNREFILHIKE